MRADEAFQSSWGRPPRYTSNNPPHWQARTSLERQAVQMQLRDIAILAAVRLIVDHRPHTPVRPCEVDPAFHQRHPAFAPSPGVHDSASLPLELPA